MKMKFILTAFAAAGLIGSATLALADSPVSAEEAEKIKGALEPPWAARAARWRRRLRAAATLKSMTPSAGMDSTTSSSTRISR
jgi:hypothetical protein